MNTVKYNIVHIHFQYTQKITISYFRIIMIYIKMMFMIYLNPKDQGT